MCHTPYQVLAELPLIQPFANHGQPHVGDLEIPGSAHPSRPLHVLGSMHFGVLWFPMCNRVYCAQLAQLLTLDSLDCPGYYSGCPIFPFVYAHQNQGI